MGMGFSPSTDLGNPFMAEARRRGLIKADPPMGLQAPNPAPVDIPDQPQEDPRALYMQEAVKRGLVKPQAVVAEMAPAVPQQYQPADISQHPALDAYRQQTLFEGRNPSNVPAAPEDRSVAVASTVARLKTQNPSFAALAPEQQQLAASRVIDTQIQNGSLNADSFGDVFSRGSRAVARLQQNKYTDPAQQQQDLNTLAQSNDQWTKDRLHGQVKDPSQYIPLGLAQGASFGLGGIVRNALNPESRGLEEAAAAEHPLGYTLSTLAGGLPGGLGVGKLGATAGQAALKALGIVGPKALALGTLASAYGAGQAANLPGTVLGAAQQGGGVSDVAGAAARQVAAFPILIGKVMKGEELSDADRIGLAMGVLNLAGGAKDVQHIFTKLPVKVAQQLHQSIDLAGELAARDPAQAQLLLKQAMDAYAPENAQVQEAAPVAKPPEAAQPNIEGPLTVEGTEGAPPESAFIRNREPPTAKTAAEPAVESGGRQVVPREEILKQVGGDHPDTAEAVDALMSMEKGDFVRADVPVEKLSIDVPTGDAAAEGIDLNKAKGYAGQEGGSAPPGVAMRLGGRGDELYIADGRHRTIAAKLRGDKTVPMFVPKEWADQHLSEKPAVPIAEKQPVLGTQEPTIAKPPTLRTQRADAKYASSKEFLSKSQEMGPRELARQAGIPYTTAQRHVGRFREEVKQAQPTTAEPVLAKELTGTQKPEVPPMADPPAGQGSESPPQGTDDTATLRGRLGEAIKIAKEQRSEARTDPLTKLANRKGQDVAAKKMFTRADAKGKNVAVATFDLSNFKALNDLHGHAAGDEALGIIADAIQKTVRSKAEPGRGRTKLDVDVPGVASRPGGDEFNVMLYGVQDEAGVRKALDRIEGAAQKALDEAGLGSINTKTGERKVSLIGGHAIREAGSKLSFEELLKQADEKAIARKSEIKKARGEPEGRFDIKDTEGVEQARTKPKELSGSTTEKLGTQEGVSEKRTSISDEAPEGMAALEQEMRSRAGGSEESQRGMRSWVSSLADEELTHLRERSKGVTRKIIDGEIAERAQPPEGEVGSPSRPAPDTSPETATSPMKLRAALRRQGRATVSPQSPHEIIAALSKDLGLSWPGVGGARALKKWAMGFYRVNPESIRLRMADDLDTHIHEVGHHLQKMIFQGGETAFGVKPGTGKRISATGLEHGKFPISWSPELEALGRRLYGSRKPAAGYQAEGWAEMIRHAFTGETDVEIDVGGKLIKIKDMKSYQETMAAMARDWPEQYAALEKFRTSYETYRNSSPVNKVASYVRRNTSRDPGTWRWYNKLRSALTDRFNALAVMNKDLGLDVPADRDPHTVALRAFGRTTGDMKLAMKYGRFDPKQPWKTLGPSLEKVLTPVRDNLVEFETYLIGRRALEKRAQGAKGVLGEMTTPDIKASNAELERIYPHFRDAAQKFQEFNRWLIHDYAVDHGLITSEVADKIVKHNLDYVTFRRVLQPSQDRPGAVSGGVNKYTGTGSGIKRFPRDMAGQQIDPPIAAFMSSMQGIMSRAENNRVGQAIVQHFQKPADFQTMPRWRLEEVAQERSIDPALTRGAIISELNKQGVRVSEVEGMGRWIDKIDRPLEAVKMGGEDVKTKLEKELKAAGVDVTDPLIDGILQLVSNTDFTAFRPGFKTDKATRQFSVLENGKPTFWEAKNEGLFRVLEGFENPAGIHGFMKWLAIPRTIYRAGATALNPDFAIANLVKDTFHALVMSGVEPAHGLAGAKARATGRFKGVMRAFLTGDPGKMYLASGADMSGLFGEYVDPKTKMFKPENLFQSPHKFRGIVHGEGVLGKALDVASTKPVWRLIDRFNQRLELATRLAEFEMKLGQGDVNRAADIYGATDRATVGAAKDLRTRADVEEAGQAAADITLDFTRGGTATVEVNKYVPFFNAAFLGGDKLARFIKQNPYKAFGKIFTFIIAPSIAQHLLNRNNPKYWNLPQQKRDQNWYFGMGDPDGDGRDEFLQIPKPYGLAALSIGVERMLARMDGLDPITGKRGDSQAFKGVGGAAAREFRPPYYVPILLPALELYMNRSIWQDSDIVRQGEQTGPKGERGAERSSEFARMFGGFMDIEPPKIDYAVQGFAAGMGSNIVQYGLDPMIRIYREDLNGYEPLVTKRPRNTQMEGFPIIKRLIAEEPKTYSEALIRFWDTFNQSEQAFRGWNARQDDPKAYDQYYKNNQASIEAYKNILPYKNDINALFKEYRLVLNDRRLSAPERQKKENKILDDILKSAQDGMKDVDKFKPKEKS